ncbi:hypothetical protein SAMN02745108_01135 [Fibrobacter intestinalis]|uniref:Uncharacterized protein n=1 Tax=Fibrobacter intestinalis TaxID=28122 RepID=A0A1T4M576_9BACT|nr:hypothetical protein BGW94_1060 [Fibrobacter sp. NR9]SJZ62055.1 hypothetical protein SAMN02745108_01135 [Fibrobacter intestinalis]
MQTFLEKLKFFVMRNALLKQIFSGVKENFKQCREILAARKLEASNEKTETGESFPWKNSTLAILRWTFLFAILCVPLFSQKYSSAKKAFRDGVLNGTFSRLGAATEQKGDRREHVRQGKPLAEVRIHGLGVDFRQICKEPVGIFILCVLTSSQILLIFRLSFIKTFAEEYFCEIHCWVGLRPEPPDFPKFSFQ